MQRKLPCALRARLPVWASCFLLPLLGGCVGGQYYGISAMNPYTRRQWAEDEELGPTFHQRIADLRQLQKAARDLDATAQQQTVPRMTELVRNDDNPLIRAAATRVLGEIPGAVAAPGIQAASVDPDPLVRMAACDAFGRRADSEATAALAQLAAQDADPDVRLAAIAALGNCRDQQAVQALSLALDDRSPAIQYRAVQSLQASTGQNLGENVAVWRAYLDGQPSPEVASESIADRFLRIFR